MRISSTKTKGYLGWRNYQTWNIALHLNNDQALYEFTREYGRYGYKRLVKALRDLGTTRTIDGVRFNNPLVDIDAIEDMLFEIGGIDSHM